MRSLLYGILIIATITALAGCSKKEPSANPAETVHADVTTTTEKPEAEVPVIAEAVKTTVEEAVVYAETGVGIKAPSLDGVEWIKGEPVTIEPGRVYIIEFWATWCPPCLKSIPHLTELQKQYKDKVTIIGVSSEKPEVIRPFVTEKGSEMDYTVVANLQGTVKKNYSQAFGQNSIPHAFIIDQNARLVWFGHPTVNGTMDETIKLVLEGKLDWKPFAKEVADAAALKKLLSDTVIKYYKMTQEQGVSEESTQLADAYIEKASDRQLNALAYNILRTSDKEKRDLGTLLKAAAKCNELVQGKNLGYLNLYASALFENNRMAEAVETQQKAVDLLNSHSNPYPKAVTEMTATLEKYKAALEAAK